MVKVVSKPVKVSGNASMVSDYSEAATASARAALNQRMAGGADRTAAGGSSPIDKNRSPQNQNLIIGVAAADKTK